jgi:hypothetical protein
VNTSSCRKAGQLSEVEIVPDQRDHTLVHGTMTYQKVLHCKHRPPRPILFTGVPRKKFLFYEVG